MAFINMSLFTLPCLQGCRALCFVALLVISTHGQTPSNKSAPRAIEAYEVTFPAMGTMLAFQTYSDDQAKVEEGFKGAQKEIERLVEILSDYSSESETVLLSQKDKVGQWQNASPELWEVLQVCDQWNKRTEGAFDASVGQLSLLWRKARKTKSVPSRSEIEAALKQCGWQYVELDSEQRRIKLKIAGLRLDFGAMGKGYVIDKAYEYLAGHGLACSLVRAGGDLRCGTAPPDREGWPIEIGRLSETERPVRFHLSNAAVSSSGDLYQYLEVDGIRRSHVLDPRTGMGVPGPRMVSVIASTSTEADAADTALCVLPDDKAISIAQSLGSIKVRIVTIEASGPRVRTTDQFPQ